MYARVGGTTFAAGAAGGVLAKTGFPVLGLGLLALCLFVSGLVLLRMAAVQREVRAGGQA